MTDDLDILAQIDAFCARYNLAESRFARLALNDPSFVYRLRAGADIKRSTVIKVRRFMEEYKARPTIRYRGRGNGHAVAA